MISITHSLITFKVCLELFKGDMSKTYDWFNKICPWVVLPDALRAYTGCRQIPHFEKVPFSSDDKPNVSGMTFPEDDVLKNLTKENFNEKVKVLEGGDYPKCAIGEKTLLEVFDAFNYLHSKYHLIKAHLKQDLLLDNALRNQMLDDSQRFSDKFYLINDNNKEINGKELREQLNLFGDLSFVELAIDVYNTTGVMPDSRWFKEHVYAALRNAYSEELAEKTFSYMIITPEMENRIVNRKHISINDQKQLGLTGNKFDLIVRDLFQNAVQQTSEEFEKFLKEF